MDVDFDNAGVGRDLDDLMRGSYGGSYPSITIGVASSAAVVSWRTMSPEIILEPLDRRAKGRTGGLDSDGPRRGAQPAGTHPELPRFAVGVRIGWADLASSWRMNLSALSLRHNACDTNRTSSNDTAKIKDNRAIPARYVH